MVIQRRGGVGWRWLLPLLALAVIFPFLPILVPPLRSLTGEEQWAAGVRGLGHLLSGRLRPYPATEPLRPVRHAGLYPFGVNTFLQNESEPDKVERSLDMIAAGGFGWIRQEFPWEDLEVHGDGWFVDLRNAEVRNGWAKYDRIVALAEARGIGVIARLSNPPAWSRAFGDANGSNAPPDTLDTYGDYVEAVVSRYRGRVRYYQVWNEPNCCAEWGNRSVSPEQYVELLRVAHTRAKAADPDAVILTAPLAPTIELVTTSDGPAPPALNDFLFLQRMYDAGAAPFFDVLAVQDYGLWSGPTDRRMRPRVINFSRPEFIRDLMLRNGDGDKAIWASEIGWNAAPDDIPPSFGRTPEELRGPYLAEAFLRQQREWPWMGVTTVWFFKPPSDAEANQPQYYFRLVEPDFTPLPAWTALTEAIRTVQPTLYRGYHQEDHWALRAGVTGDGWPLVAEPQAVWEQAARGAAGATLRFAVEGERLTLVVAATSNGVVVARVGDQTRRFDLDGSDPQATPATDAGKSVLHLPLGALPAGRVAVEFMVESGQIALDGVIVE